MRLATPSFQNNFTNTAVAAEPSRPSSMTARMLSDSDVNEWLKRSHREQHVVTMVYAKHRCAFYSDGEPDELYPADPEWDSKKTLRLIARAGRLRRLELSEAILRDAIKPEAGWSQAAISADEADIKHWLKARAAMFDIGRGKPLSAPGSRRVWHDAAGRCMFRGCGMDLGRTSLTTASAAVGYLAHIVAADPDGPRGCNTDSYRLSDDPENVMLMCDEHHRLIDRVDPDGFSVPLLREMRREHVDMVRRSLDCLTYPRSKAMAILANVAGVWSQASERDIRQAMLERSLASLPSVRYPLRRTQRDDRTQPDFWRHLLHEHALELDAFMRELIAHREQEDYAEVLSVFPLHSMPLLLLTGRMVGEARKVEVFQYHRHRGTWCWDSAARPKPAGEFYLEGESRVGSTEALLSIELTASLDEQALPSHLQEAVRQSTVPWIRLRATAPNNACIGHPDDLEQFTAIARQAIAVIQDSMRAAKVHLIPIAPASTLFRFGQLLQPGHHCKYIIHDRPNHAASFMPALIIEGQQATDAMAPGSARTTSIQLR
ncbi:SAVED domain-containing protein [Massilia timonae]|uniref:SAVED domain-containing protein n=1 Tax=Massilia timonae TaxID=47229 RepID=UPI0028A134EA|nr:SAVED domain-containing protein [Massilia timonae]